MALLDRALPHTLRGGHHRGPSASRILLPTAPPPPEAAAALDPCRAHTSSCLPEPWLTGAARCPPRQPPRLPLSSLALPGGACPQLRVARRVWFHPCRGSLTRNGGRWRLWMTWRRKVVLAAPQSDLALAMHEMAASTMHCNDESHIPFLVGLHQGPI